MEGGYWRKIGRVAGDDVQIEVDWMYNNEHTYR